MTAIQQLAIQAKDLPEYIVVDLDGTLILTDTFLASLLEGLRGRAECKRKVSALVQLDVTVLPYNDSLISYLRKQRVAGRKIILATGAYASIANEVARHLGIFDAVLATEGNTNLTGVRKLRAVRERIGKARFSYAGNSRADMTVWRGSDAAIVVDSPQSRSQKLRDGGLPIELELPKAHVSLGTLLRCLRPHQWSKNVLVFLPLLLAHHIWDLRALRLTAIGFIALSLIASTLYVVNDLLDLQADRLHPRKRNRPLASGVLSLSSAFVLICVLAVAASTASTFLPSAARWLLVGYAIGVLAYSTMFKRVLFLDIVSLALFYSVRVLYGGAVSGIPLSIWTLACSLFLFTSLAAIKRLTELRRVSSHSARTEEYRGYSEADITPIVSLASASGYVSVLVLALYINSSDVVLLYKHRQGLWLLCPLLILWISRMCLFANRGSLDDDPVAFALKDRATWIIGIICAIVVLFSTR
jgi:4-hydroxybenzoate polyprenyltransferase